ncbi:MAG: YihY/virulence factor BrkB family protein [Nitriliruptor sp.]|uniref:YihY/virulence factor BrkB family protein n=1 Tax=Nitriliruptor sp. TaxID=2448056 RepID=UPI0034A033BE
MSRVVASLKQDHVSLLAAGVAFKGLLAIFPAIIAGISIWGLVADPATITRQMGSITSALPESASGLLTDQMENVAGSDSSTLGVALAVSVLIALWSASGGMAGLIEGINAAYDEIDRRKFPKKRGLALLLTVGAILGLLLTIGLIAVLPPALETLGLGRAGELAVRIGTWPLLALLAIAGLALLYKVSPDRDQPRTRWVTWGAVIATVLWLLGSAAFTLYVENFGSFGETYGTFAGIIVLMLWLFLSAFIVLLGAEINAETERQTARDTTVGDPVPLGRRDAVSADTTPADWNDERGVERGPASDTTPAPRSEQR